MQKLYNNMGAVSCRKVFIEKVSAKGSGAEGFVGWCVWWLRGGMVRWER